MTMPVFTIKAKDRLAIEAVIAYRDLCLDEGLHEQADEVQLALHEMVAWRAEREDLVQTPDHKHVPAAPTSPSEPVPSTPRVWAIPEIPEDVSAVRDGTGNEWARGGKHGPGVMWHCRTDEGAYYRPLTTFELLRGRGPLTEVEETNDEPAT